MMDIDRTWFDRIGQADEFDHDDTNTSNPLTVASDGP
jgi:hypothetical protein